MIAVLTTSYIHFRAQKCVYMMMYMYFEYWNIVNFKMVDTSGSFEKSWNVVNPHPVRYMIIYLKLNRIAFSFYV